MNKSSLKAIEEPKCSVVGRAVYCQLRAVTKTILLGSIVPCNRQFPFEEYIYFAAQKLPKRASPSRSASFRLSFTENLFFIISFQAFTKDEYQLLQFYYDFSRCIVP